MKNRYVLLTIVALLAFAVPASAAGDKGSAPSRNARELAESESDSEPGSTVSKAPGTVASTPAGTTADEPSPEEPKPAQILTPSPDVGPVSGDGAAPEASWSVAQKPDREGHGSKKEKGGGKGHGGWRPPAREPHGKRGQWRRNRYSVFGSWHFLFHTGPRVYYVPHTTHVIRLPRTNGIYVRQTGDDALGRAFATSIRRQLLEHGLRVVYDADDAALELYIVSMEDDPEDPGWGSAVSVSYLSNPGKRFITGQMIDVGDEQVDELALLVVEYVDELAEEYCR